MWTFDKLFTGRVLKEAVTDKTMKSFFVKDTLRNVIATEHPYEETGA